MRRGVPAAILLAMLATSVGVPAATTLPTYRCQWAGFLDVNNAFQGGLTFTIVGGNGSCSGDGTGTYRIAHLAGSGKKVSAVSPDFQMATTMTMRRVSDGRTLQVDQTWSDPVLDGGAARIDGDTTIAGEGSADVPWTYAAVDPAHVPAQFSWTFVYSRSKRQLFHCTWKGVITVGLPTDGTSTENGSGTCLNMKHRWSIVFFSGSDRFFGPIYPGNELMYMNMIIRDRTSGVTRKFEQFFDLSVPTQITRTCSKPVDTGRNYRYVVRIRLGIPIGVGSATNYACYTGNPDRTTTRTATFDWDFLTNS